MYVCIRELGEKTHAKSHFTYVQIVHCIYYSLTQSMPTRHCLDKFIKLHLWPFYLIYSGCFFTSALVFWYFYSNRFSICPAENLLLSFYCWLPGILMSNRFEYTLSFHFIAYLTFGICFPMETSKKKKREKNEK